MILIDMNKSQIVKLNRSDRWLVFLCKSYVFAVPIAFIIAQYLANLYDRAHPPAHPTNYYEDQMAGRIVVKEVAEKLRLIVCGYFFCLMVFLQLSFTF